VTGQAGGGGDGGVGGTVRLLSLVLGTQWNSRLYLLVICHVTFPSPMTSVAVE
jgi:hypothetical protein